MNKFRKNRNREKSLEQRAFETLNKQIHQFDEPNLQNYLLKGGYSETGSKAKPLRFAVNFKLKNDKTISGTCVCFDNQKIPKSKLFFPTGQRDSGGNSKDFYIPSHINPQTQGGNISLMNGVNNFLRDIHEQARSEFPEWLEKWGCRAGENNPLLNLDEIREEWRCKKGQFGIFRLAVQAGFFTGFRPSKAERQEIVKIEIHDFVPNFKA